MSLLDGVFVLACAWAGILALLHAVDAARTLSALGRFGSDEDGAPAAISAYSRTFLMMSAIAVGYVLAAVLVPSALVAGVVTGLAVAAVDHRINRVLKPQRRAVAALVQAARKAT